MKKNKKCLRFFTGFTIVEIIVVIAIIGILGAILIPIFNNVINSSKEKTCIYNRNEIIKGYRVEKMLGYGGSASQFLEDNDAFFSKENACPSGGEYEIISNGEMLGIKCSEHGNIVYLNSHSKSSDVYNFANWTEDDLNDAIIYGSFEISTNGEDTVLQNTVGEDRIFFPLNYEEYDVVSTVQLDGGNGYAVLIEADVDEDGIDSGFAIQFDRGYGDGRIVVRPREYGSEDSPIYTDDPRDDIVEVNDDWWNETHQFTIKVRQHDDEYKSGIVYIDGIAINEDNPYLFLKREAYENTRAVGYRTWGSSISSFYDLEIIPSN